MRPSVAVALFLMAVAGCGGGHRTTNSAALTQTSMTMTATTPAYRSDGRLLRLLPASCRQQLVDPTIPVAVRQQMRRRFLITLHAARPPHVCDEISAKLRPPQERTVAVTAPPGCKRADIREARARPGHRLLGCTHATLTPGH